MVAFSQLDTFVTSDITSFELNTSGKKNVHYIFLNPENKIKVMEGNFVDNKKDGLWLYYDRGNNKIIHSQNSYKLGIKDGIWIERYLNSEQIERKEEYADGKLLSGHYYKENGAEAPFKGKIYNYCEQMPTTKYDLNKYIRNNVKYPQVSKLHGIEGRVIVKFVVLESGSIAEVSVVKGLDDACNEEAMRVVRNMPAWIPGKQDGVPVSVYFTLPLTFK